MIGRAREELEAALGARLLRASRVHGGDVGEAFRAELDDGRRVFVKTQAGADPRAFACEARGLAWLGEGPLRVPRALAAGASFLALEWIEPGAPGASSDERLGRGLARLHRLGAPAFGLAEDNFLAGLPMDNGAEPDWPGFYGRRRLEPLLRRARDGGLATAAIVRGGERVLRDLARLSGPPEPPARLHGDLWGGNVLHDRTGSPVLVDPAVYGGHREIDLAMMRLFGGFGPAVFAAYEDEAPLAPGHEARVPLYQLLPLLVHLVLFGTGYAAAVERALERTSRGG